MPRIIKLTDRIQYLQVSYDPLSADVVAVRGDSAWWIFDVGACDEAVNFINALPRNPVGSEPLEKDSRGSLENSESAAPVAISLKKNIVVQKKTFEQQKECDFSFGIANLARFRANAYLQRGCVALALRIIPLDIKTFKDLGLPKIMAEFTTRPSGLVLVTGATGSGKSTTLAAMIDKINKERHDHILTVEDPIEFLHKHQGCMINQREVGSDTHSFAQALKMALRQDPDVVLIGEMRDYKRQSSGGAWHLRQSGPSRVAHNGARCERRRFLRRESWRRHRRRCHPT